MLLQVYYTQCQMFQSAECCFPKLLVLPEMNLLPAVCAVFLGTLELENCKVCAVLCPDFCYSDQQQNCDSFFL